MPAAGPGLTVAVRTPALSPNVTPLLLEKVTTPLDIELAPADSPMPDPVPPAPDMTRDPLDMPIETRPAPDTVKLRASTVPKVDRTVFPVT